MNSIELTTQTWNSAAESLKSTLSGSPIKGTLLSSYTRDYQPIFPKALCDRLIGIGYVTVEEVLSKTNATLYSQGLKDIELGDIKRGRNLYKLDKISKSLDPNQNSGQLSVVKAEYLKFISSLENSPLICPGAKYGLSYEVCPVFKRRLAHSLVNIGFTTVKEVLDQHENIWFSYRSNKGNKKMFGPEKIEEIYTIKGWLRPDGKELSSSVVQEEEVKAPVVLKSPEPVAVPSPVVEEAPKTARKVTAVTGSISLPYEDELNKAFEADQADEGLSIRSMYKKLGVTDVTVFNSTVIHLCMLREIDIINGMMLKMS